jgi:hypothetical protein
MIKWMASTSPIRRKLTPAFATKRKEERAAILATLTDACKALEEQRRRKHIAALTLEKKVAGQHHIILFKAIRRRNLFLPFKRKDIR